MGGKRRFSKHHGIRKKRKNPNKQTLARVAERKEEQDAKLERKLADAEARIRTHRLGILGGIPQHEEPELIAETEPVMRYSDAEEDVERSKILTSKIENQQRAYEKLSTSLESSLFDENAGGQLRKIPPKSEKPVPKRPRVSSRRPKIDQNGTGSQIQTGTIIEEEPSQDIIAKENHRAAIREKAHFDTSVKPLALEGKLATICSESGLGKASALVSEQRRSRLEASLKTDLASFGASRIGMPTSVYSKWTKLVEDIRATDKKRGNSVLKPVHRASIAVIREYHDLFLSHRLSAADEDMMRRILVAHCVSHVLRCRGRVLRNDATKKADENAADDMKDQGFSRARVLLLLPFKNVAYEVVKMFQHLAVGAEEGQENVSHVANSERFEAEFAPMSEADAMNDSNAENRETTALESRIRTSARQSDEHQRLFRGNIDDDFKLGIALSKKTMNLYTDFYASDIIIASPLGLRRTMAEKSSGQGRHASQKQKEKDDEDTEWKTGLGADAEKPKFDDAEEDFLSSIEICVIDGANVFSMQNWDTLLETLAMTNKMPASTRDTDFSRVRDWCLDGLMARFRQTVILSSYRKAEFMTLFRELSNHAGRVQIVEALSRYGSMSDVAVRMRQTFFKVPGVASPSDVPEKRLNFFFEEILPQIRALLDSQCLLVVPNYFDFVRVRSRLVKVSEDDPSFRFASMCEYSKGSAISRARSRMFDRTVSMVVMTERFHFFWRHWIRGANTVVWYGLPENCHYYPEILNMTMEAAEVGRPVQAMALYDSVDAFPLERIVGRTRCKKMLAEDSRSTFLFA